MRLCVLLLFLCFLPVPGFAALADLLAKDPRPTSGYRLLRGVHVAQLYAGDDDDMNEIDDPNAIEEDPEKRIQKKEKKEKKKKKKAAKKSREESEVDQDAGEGSSSGKDSKGSEEGEGGYNPFKDFKDEGGGKDAAEDDANAPDDGNATDDKEEDSDSNPFEKDFIRRLVLTPKSVAVAVGLSFFVGFGTGNFYAQDYYIGYLTMTTQFLGIAIAGIGFNSAWNDPNNYFTDSYFVPGEYIMYAGLLFFMVMRVFDISNSIKATREFNERHKMKLKRLNEISFAPVVIERSPGVALAMRF